ncbi:MAG: glycosyltransferase family 4 protein [Deltaproteobacteria bacterium]|nr:glycosyltransferase family 4 protein [Deltaproteobacteria bacterium]
MKIAMALENFSRHGGGVESYAVELARTLIRANWEVHFFGHSWDGEPEGAIFHQIRKLHRFCPPSWKLMDFALCHRRMVRTQHFDILLGFGNTLVMNVYQSHGGVHFLSNMRKIAGIRNPLLRLMKLLALFTSPKYHARAWIESAPFRSAHRPVLVAISDMVRNDIESYFRVPDDEVLLVYNGTDPTRFAAASLENAEELRRTLGFDSEVLFLFMAYDMRKKGIHYLIEAAAQLRDRAAPKSFGVVVVGRPPYPGLKRLVRKLNLSDMVVFTGPTREPETYFRACDVFVLPTFYDACSLVVFEALAAGKPVITTIFNGAAGAISDGIEGMVLRDPKDVTALSRAMGRFLDKEFVVSASEAARHKGQFYTVENNHRKMIAIFDTLLQKA